MAQALLVRLAVRTAQPCASSRPRTSWWLTWCRWAAPAATAVAPGAGRSTAVSWRLRATSNRCRSCRLGRPTGCWSGAAAWLGRGAARGGGGVPRSAAGAAGRRPSRPGRGALVIELAGLDIPCHGRVGCARALQDPSPRDPERDAARGVPGPARTGTRVQMVLVGPLPDQAALHGVLAWIEALGLELLEVRRLGS